ncbi:MAG: hypothetical protein RR086_02400 [Clostridia bacterium]
MKKIPTKKKYIIDIIEIVLVYVAIIAYSVIFSMYSIKDDGFSLSIIAWQRGHLRESLNFIAMFGLFFVLNIWDLSNFYGIRHKRTVVILASCGVGSLLVAMSIPFDGRVDRLHNIVALVAVVFTATSMGYFVYNLKSVSEKIFKKSKNIYIISICFSVGVSVIFNTLFFLQILLVCLMCGELFGLSLSKDIKELRKLNGISSDD